MPRSEDVSLPIAPGSDSHHNFLDNWSKKAIRRRQQGSGRMRYLKHVFRKQKNGFREGTKAVSVKRKAA
jgi:hypothetical protein